MSKIILYIKRKKAKPILVLPLLYAVTHSALLYSALRDINKYVVAFVMRKSSVLTVGTSVFKKALQSYNFFLNCAIVRELFLKKIYDLSNLFNKLAFFGTFNYVNLAASGACSASPTFRPEAVQPSQNQ